MSCINITLLFPFKVYKRWKIQNSVVLNSTSIREGLLRRLPQNDLDNKNLFCFLFMVLKNNDRFENLTILLNKVWVQPILLNALLYSLLMQYEWCNLMNGVLLSLWKTHPFLWSILNKFLYDRFAALLYPSHVYIIFGHYIKSNHFYNFQWKILWNFSLYNVSSI